MMGFVTLGLAAIAGTAVAGADRRAEIEHIRMLLDAELLALDLEEPASPAAAPPIASYLQGRAYLWNSGIESYRAGLVTFGHASEISALTTAGAATLSPPVVPAAARRVDDIASARLGNVWANNAADSYRRGVRTAAGLLASISPLKAVLPPAKKSRKKATTAPPRPAIAAGSRAAASAPADKQKTRNSPFPRASSAVVGASAETAAAPTNVIVEPSRSAFAEKSKAAVEEGTSPVGETSNSLRWKADAALDSFFTHQAEASSDSAKRTVSARGKGAVERAKAALAKKRSTQLAEAQAAQLARAAEITALRANAKAARAKEAVQRAKASLKAAAAAAPPPTATASSPVIVSIRRNRTARRAEVPSVATVVDDVTVKVEEKAALPARPASMTSTFAASGKPGFWTGFVYTMALVILAVAGVVGGAGCMIMETEGKTSRSRRASLTPPAAFSDLASSSATSIFSDDSRIRCRRHSSGISAFA